MEELKHLLIAQRYQIIFVGETHGSKQNAVLIQDICLILLQAYTHIAVAFEWPLTPVEGEALRGYVHGGSAPETLPDFFLHSDGRFTYEHVGLFVWMREYVRMHGDAIDVLFFDTKNERINREDAMGQILNAYQENHSDRVILAETGNFHARKNAKNTQRSLATNLQDRYAIFSIFVRYLSGNIMVDGEMRDVTKASSQRQGPDHFFDACIEIQRSDAADEPSDLTKIKEMFTV